MDRRKKLFLVLIPITIIIGFSFLVLNLNFFEGTHPERQVENKPFAYRAFMTEIYPILSSNNIDSLSLPDTLIISSGKYNFYNYTFDLNEEGLYRFIFVDQINQQRIVYDGGNPDVLLSGVTWIYSHGNSDNSKSTEIINKEALSRKIFGTCGSISNWIQQLLDKHNLESRVVATLTLDQWNSYDNGHTMIEVFRNDYGKWVVYDLDNNAYFLKDNKPLSLIEFVESVKNDDYDIKFLASDTTLDISNFKSSSEFDFAFFSEGITANENTLRNWYQHVIQVPLIKHEGNFYYFDSENLERISKYSKKYTYIEKSDFMELFYG